MAIIEKPKITVAETAKVFSYDSELIENILMLASSASLSIPSIINSVKHSCCIIGVKQLKQILLVDFTISVTDKAVPGYGMGSGDLRRHSRYQLPQ